jgi:uncharacterized SAM-binding protein YcdF (DUF218 family)
MFYIVSKLLYFLVVPFNWVAILLFISVLTKNKKLQKKLQVSIIVILIIFSNPYLFYKLLHAWQINKSELQKNKQYQAGIILGGLSGYDRSGNSYFNEAGDRFIQTLKLYNQGTIKKIIVTGGGGLYENKNPVEGDLLREEFLKNKVSAADLIIENKSRSTYENAIFTKKILDSLHISDTMVLISSASHLRRSKMVFKNAGFKTVAYPCDFEFVDLFHTPLHYVWPNLNAFNGWAKLIKELIGTAAYKMTGKA